MSKPVLVLAVLVLVFAMAPTTARADADGHVNFFLGQKSLDSDDWDPIDSQGEFGAIMSFGKTSWPVHIAVDVLVSAAEKDVADPLLGSATFTGSTTEIAPGVRKIWQAGKSRPYVGAGFALIGAAAEIDNGFLTVDGDGTGFGPWVSAGVFWRLGARFNIGLDLRWSDAEVDLDFGQGIIAPDVKVGGFHAGMTLGFGW